MHRHALLLSAALALAAPSAASAMQDTAAAPSASARVDAQASAHQAAPGGIRVAIILQRKPAKQKGKQAANGSRAEA